MQFIVLIFSRLVETIPNGNALAAVVELIDLLHLEGAVARRDRER